MTSINALEACSYHCFYCHYSEFRRKKVGEPFGTAKVWLQSIDIFTPRPTVKQWCLDLGTKQAAKAFFYFFFYGLAINIQASQKKDFNMLLFGLKKCAICLLIAI